MNLQRDIAFQHIVMECFTATCPETMGIEAEACAKVEYKVVSDEEDDRRLVENGNEQLTKYDNYAQRANKLVGILDIIAV